MKQGFDNDKYLRIQSEHIRERISQYGNKLYLEFGGKLFDDYHASRVLPGFQPDSKLRMLMQLSNQLEIIIVISAEDIEKNKVRADLGITYADDVLRLRDEFQSRNLMVGAVAITHFNGQSSAIAYRERLERLGIKVSYQYLIKDYPTNVDLICSDEGFGRNEYIETSHPLVVVTAPGPGSGKMAVCLSQLYLENKHGVKAGYAKFETFPIWSIPLKHPVNVAYEAATADLNDVNMIDPFHLEAYGKTTVNYNRDIEIFPVLNAIFESIYGENPYKSPTDMGVNMAGFCISDDDVCCQASKDEIIRRYYASLCNFADGRASESEVNKIKLLMKQLKLTTDDRPTTVAAHQREDQENAPSSAIQLADGSIITAHSSNLLSASAALIINALKHLSGIDHALQLIPQQTITPIQKTKVEMLHSKAPRLHSDEVLVTLSILSLSDPNCRKALDCLPQLEGCQVHATKMLSEVDRKIFKRLGIEFTTDPVKVG